jgi:hypothetical protein
MATRRTEEIRELIKQELPILMRQDPEIQRMVLRLAHEKFADRVETEDRFTRLLEELRKDREEQSRKWDENQQELARVREEQNRKWDENQLELARIREEQNRRWEENGKELLRLHEEIMAIAQKHDRSIGALGARWGTSSETAFRNALAAILEKSFHVRVINVQDYDAEGAVFGRPDQVELDVIILDGTAIAIEIKSSMSRGEMYLFERKVRFYERRSQRRINRMMVISPMIDSRAQEVGNAFGIEMYSDSIDVKSL